MAAQDILDTIKSGLGELASTGMDMGKAIASLPLSVATIPTDLARNPEVFFGGSGRGGVDIPALFSSDYRKRKVANERASREWDSIKQKSEFYKVVQDMFSEQATDTAQGNIRKALEASGVPASITLPAAGAAKAERHAARRAALESGSAPSVANIADIDSAQQLGQTRFASDRQLREIGAQGTETRRNQASQFGYSRDLENLRNENDIARARYGAELDVWKDSVGKGDPYPILQGLYDSGHFKDNPALEQVVGYQVYNRVDPESARDLLKIAQEGTRTQPKTDSAQAALIDLQRRPDAWDKLTSQQRDLVQAAIAGGEETSKDVMGRLGGSILPPPSRGGVTVGGATGTTGAERAQMRDVMALRKMLRTDQVPAHLRDRARAAVKSGSATLTRQVMADVGRLSDPRTVDWTASARRFLGTEDFGKLPPDRQAALTDAVAKNDRTYLNFVMPALEKRDMGMAEAVLSNPLFKKYADEANKAANSRLSLADAEKMAYDPTGSGVDPGLFSPALAAMLPDDPSYQSVALSMFDDDWAARKQALVAANTKVVSEYIFNMSGKVSNQYETQRFKSVAPTGNEASGELYLVKKRIFDSALQREEEIARREAEAIGRSLERGDWTGVLPKGEQVGFRAQRDESIRQATRELEAVAANPDLQPTGELTDAEKAELARRGWNGNR